jgi:hypothetical protein
MPPIGLRHLNLAKIPVKLLSNGRALALRAAGAPQPQGVVGGARPAVWRQTTGWCASPGGEGDH